MSACIVKYVASFPGNIVYTVVQVYGEHHIIIVPCPCEVYSKRVRTLYIKCRWFSSCQLHLIGSLPCQCRCSQTQYWIKKKLWANLRNAMSPLSQPLFCGEATFDGVSFHPQYQFGHSTLHEQCSELLVRLTFLTIDIVVSSRSHGEYTTLGRQ